MPMVLAASSMLRWVSNAATASSCFRPNFVPWPFIYRNLTQPDAICAFAAASWPGPNGESYTMARYQTGRGNCGCCERDKEWPPLRHKFLTMSGHLLAGAGAVGMVAGFAGAMIGLSVPE